jgi:hypothetical protein
MTAGKVSCQDAAGCEAWHTLGERVLLMKFREQGRSLQALSRETGVPRRLLSQRGKRYRDKVESRCCASTCGGRSGRHDESRPGCDGAFRRVGVKEWAGMDRSGNGSTTAAFVAAGEAHRDKVESRCCVSPLAATAAVATTNRGLDATAHSVDSALRSGPAWIAAVATTNRGRDATAHFADSASRSGAGMDRSGRHDESRLGCNGAFCRFGV